MQKQIAGGTTTVYVHDVFGKLAAEYSSAGVSPGCKTCYLSYDQLGSIRLITDSAGNIVGRHDFLPFGEEMSGGSGGRNGNSFGNNDNVTQMFTGQERDGGTADLDYFNARHFSAVVGSFMQPDPGNAGADILRPQSWNAYAYFFGESAGNDVIRVGWTPRDVQRVGGPERGAGVDITVVALAAMMVIPAFLMEIAFQRVHLHPVAVFRSVGSVSRSKLAAVIFQVEPLRSLRRLQRRF